MPKSESPGTRSYVSHRRSKSDCEPKEDCDDITKLVYTACYSFGRSLQFLLGAGFLIHLSLTEVAEYEFGFESSLTLTSLVVNLVYGVVKQEIFSDFP